MPRTILPVLLCLVLLAGLPAHAQTRRTASGLELSVRPDLLIPLGEDGDYYRLGFGAAARVRDVVSELRAWCDAVDVMLSRSAAPSR